MFLSPLFIASSLLAAADAPRPKVLIIGDSISIGYTPFVQQLLADIADVSHPKGNCEGTIKGVADVEQWIEDCGKPDVITFNFGLHDLKRIDPDNKQASNNPEHLRQSEPDRYREQLQRIVTKLQASGAKLAFVTTTPVPSGGVKPHRSVGDVLYYNAIARQIVEPQGIEVIDLFDVAQAKLAEWQKPVDVHFTETGSQALAKVVSDSIRRILTSEPNSQTKSWSADPQLVKKLSSSSPFIYDEEKVPQYTLPSLQLNDAANDRDRQLHLQSLVRQFEDHFYGKPPAAAESLKGSYTVEKTDPDAADGIAVGQQIRLTFRIGEREFSFPILLYTPKKSAGPSPAFVLINNQQFPELIAATRQPMSFMPVSMLIQRGYAVATFFTSDVDPDRADGRAQGIRGFCDAIATDEERSADNAWGSLTAWAWGSSRVLDYLTTREEVDADRVAVIGHSRGGKTALWAGARDQRFAFSISNESGCGGAALSRRCYGETIARITTAFPHWFCRKLNDYATHEDRLPIDQHQLIASIAPRKVYVASANEDLWADPRGEYLSLVNAAPAFLAFNKQAISETNMPALGEQRAVGQTGYHVRPGKHNLTEGDWIQFVDFWDGASR